MEYSDIKELKINNPILLGEQISDKQFILDINMLLNNEKIIHLELQVVSQSYWPERSLCYLCENFKQLNAGDNYDLLKPLIQIDILDFELYKGSTEFYSVYHLANDKTHRIYSDKLALHVLELNKEKYATAEDKSYSIDYWAKIFKSTTWEELKMLAQEHANLQSTVEAIYRVNADEEARFAILARERYLRDQRTQQDRAKRQDKKISEQAETIAEQADTIADQADTIAEQQKQLASKDEQLASKDKEVFQKLKDKIQRKIAKGKSLKQIAEELEEDIEDIRPLYDELLASSKLS